MPSTRTPSTDGSRLYVSNFPWSNTENDLQPLFTEFGTVHSVVIIKDRQSGASRGFGFVEMASPEAAQEAIKNLNGLRFGGRALNVQLAREKEKR